MKIKIIVFFILNILVNTLYAQNTLKQELSDVFLGLPIASGYDSIVKNGKINFKVEYVNLPLPIHVSQDSAHYTLTNHWIKLDTISESLREVKSCEILISKGYKGFNTNFSVTMNCYFKDKESVLNGFYYLAEKFEAFSLKTTTERTKTKKDEIVQESILFKFYGHNENRYPYFMISYDLDVPEKKNRNMLVLTYFFDRL